MATAMVAQRAPARIDFQLHLRMVAPLFQFLECLKEVGAHHRRKPKLLAPGRSLRTLPGALKGNLRADMRAKSAAEIRIAGLNRPYRSERGEVETSSLNLCPGAATT
jgi:hypothetical protein